MNKLAIIVPFYRRPELTKLCFERLCDQSERLDVDVIVAGSEGNKSRRLAKGLKYIETPNILGAKLNGLLKECKAYDGVILLGSDDFISDSVIRMYQEIRTDVKVFYSFNDVYVYSSRIGKLVSDLDYTRAGNGIGVARMFTKPTLEAVNYQVWTDDKQRAMDGDCQTTMFKHGIKDARVPLGDHFVIDVKFESNLTSHEIVNTGHKDHKIETIANELGVIGEQILKIKATEPERIILKTETMLRKNGTVIKAFNHFKVGMTYSFKAHSFRELKASGYIKEEVVKVVKKVKTKTPAAKKTVKKK